MKSTPELEAEMLRLHYAEHWPVGTIATQLAAHPDQVRRVLGLGDARAPSQMRTRLVDPYRPFIDDTLARYPKLRATRLYDMLRERGYPGSIRTLREFVATVRPRPRREPYLLTETLPGEQAQVDWAFVGKLAFPGGERALWSASAASILCTRTTTRPTCWHFSWVFVRRSFPSQPPMAGPATPPRRSCSTTLWTGCCSPASRASLPCLPTSRIASSPGGRDRNVSRSCRTA